jgi:hypothetical protein
LRASLSKIEITSLHLFGALEEFLSRVTSIFQTLSVQVFDKKEKPKYHELAFWEALMSIMSLWPLCSSNISIVNWKWMVDSEELTWAKSFKPVRKGNQPKQWEIGIEKNELTILEENRMGIKKLQHVLGESFLFHQWWLQSWINCNIEVEVGRCCNNKWNHFE